ncbi:hypothetical protein AAVH_14419 [Aphelenchoides avenae]|nr:hypothetical protein AAVH_14419 [Aphelenchus avenae]
MPFVEALEWYAEPKRCQIVSGNFHIAHVTGIRQADLDWILREIRVIEGFLHIHAVDLNINLPKRRTIYAKDLTGQNPLENCSAVYVEDFRGSYIRMPELRDVARSSFGVRHASNPCGWNTTLEPGFHPGRLTRRRAKHYSDRVVLMDVTTSNCKGLRAKFGSKTLCLDADKCPSRYYLSRGNASEGTIDECKMCDESCVTCDGPESHFGKGSCTEVWVRLLEGTRRQVPGNLHGLGAPRDVNPAYELSKDLPPVGDDGSSKRQRRPTASNLVQKFEPVFGLTCWEFSAINVFLAAPKGTAFALP